MNALYYPFHLCHEHTLTRLLKEYQVVHFRDFMALQLTPMMGTTAFPDRMGDYYPDLLKTGQITQGHNVGGAMAPATILSVNQDLADLKWRENFQNFLQNDPRFQRGLFPNPQEQITTPNEIPQTPELLKFTEKEWTTTSFDVETIQEMSRRRLQGSDAVRFEYGWALIKTSASLIYTIQLCRNLNLAAATDSISHHDLLAQTCQEQQMALENFLVTREGY